MGGYDKLIELPGDSKNEQWRPPIVELGTELWLPAVKGLRGKVIEVRSLGKDVGGNNIQEFRIGWDNGEESDWLKNFDVSFEDPQKKK